MPTPSLLAEPSSPIASMAFVDDMSVCNWGDVWLYYSLVELLWKFLLDGILDSLVHSHI